MATPYGKYVLLKRLAVGGMAEIFLAKQTGLEGFEKLVVVKRILPEFAADKEFLGMFLDEARLAATLSHPNVVQVYDLGQADGMYFIAMEFIAGHDVAALRRAAVRRRMHLPLDVVARIVAGACEGLHYAHTRRDRKGAPLSIVHRDVSPSNLIVSYEGNVKVVDFGIAKAESHTNKTRAGSLKGKYGYMSPEQVQGLPLDARSDVFALGVTLFELLTLRRPFSAESELAVIHAILHAEPPAPSTLRTDVPEALDAIVRRALMKNRDERYGSAHELQMDLERYLAGLKQPASNAQVGAYLVKVFEEEHRAHQDFLAMLPTAAASELEDYLRGQGPPTTQSGSSFEAVHLPGGTEPAPASSGVFASPRRRAVAGAVVAACLVAGLGWALRRGGPAPSLGSLTVESQPAGAAVRLDDEDTHLRTPAVLSNVALGSAHRLHLELEGREPMDLTVSLRPEAPHQAVSVALARVVAPAAVDAGAPAPLAPVAPAVAAAPASSGGGPRSHPLVAFELESVPPAEVRYRGRLLGTTPLHARLPEGPAELVFSNAALSLEQTRVVGIHAGRTTERVTFGRGKLAVDVTPWADVYLGEKKLGTTPLAPKELFEGRYTVRLINGERGAIKTVSVVVVAGNTTVLREKL